MSFSIIVCFTTSIKKTGFNNGNPFGAVDYALNKDKILNTGLQMLEYEGDRSYHGKSIVIDDDLAIVGSFNMDMKSVYQDTELMLVVHSKELNAQLKKNFMHYQSQANPAVLDNNEIKTLLTEENVSWLTRLQRWGIKVLNPCLRFLF